MTNFAQLENNVVTQVIVVADEALIDVSGTDFCTSLLGGTWLASDSSLYKNEAAIGFTYDPVRDAFIAPKPYPSWVLIESTCQWESSVTQTHENTEWDEDTLTWITFELKE